MFNGTQIKLNLFNNFSPTKLGINFGFNSAGQNLLLSINICLDIFTSIFGGDENKSLQVLEKIKQNLPVENSEIYGGYVQILAKVLLLQTKISNENKTSSHENTKLFFEMLVEYYQTGKYKILIEDWKHKYKIEL